MIEKLVQSAFQTGYLSVESEGLIRQMVTARTCRPADLAALETLYGALRSGQVQREAHAHAELVPLRQAVQPAPVPQ